MMQMCSRFLSDTLALNTNCHFVHLLIVCSIHLSGVGQTIKNQLMSVCAYIRLCVRCVCVDHIKVSAVDNL